MSELDKALLERLVSNFSVNKRNFVMVYDMFRNKISRLMTQCLVYIVYYSRIAFYSLKEFTFDVNNIKSNHMVVPQHVNEQLGAYRLQSYVNTLDSNANAVHDIHTKFNVPGIYKIISSNPKYGKAVNFRSKDIGLEKYSLDDVRTCITVHKTNTVTVRLACSKRPILLDEKGIARLSSVLDLAQTRLSRIINENNIPESSIGIPHFMDWLVTLWHFGKDRFHNEHAAKGYAVTWGSGSEVLRCYAKGKHIQRAERQESPNKSLAEALKEKMEARSE